MSVDEHGNGEIDIPEAGGICKVEKGVILNPSGKAIGYYDGNIGGHTGLMGDKIETKKVKENEL